MGRVSELSVNNFVVCSGRQSFRPYCGLMHYSIFTVTKKHIIIIIRAWHVIIRHVGLLKTDIIHIYILLQFPTGSGYFGFIGFTGCKLLKTPPRGFNWFHTKFGRHDSKMFMVQNYQGIIYIANGVAMARHSNNTSRCAIRKSGIIPLYIV